MQKEYKTKDIKPEAGGIPMEVKVKNRYYYPSLGKTIEANNREEADKLAGLTDNKITKE